MTPMQISLVQNSWQQVLPIRDQAAAYELLATTMKNAAAAEPVTA